MNLLLKLLCPIYTLWRDWSEKQQRIYEEYQAQAPVRNALARYEIVVTQAFIDLAHEQYIQRQFEKAKANIPLYPNSRNNHVEDAVISQNPRPASGGVTSKDGKRLHRLTYSKDVAELCASYGDYTVKRMKLRRGRQLEPGEESKTGVYMVCSAKCASPLRATLIQGIAATHYDCESRLIYEGFLEP